MSLGDEIAGDGEEGILDAEVSVNDEQFNNRRRLQAINDARDRVTRALMVSTARRLEGAITQYEQRQMVRTAVEAYYHEVRPVITERLHSTGDDVASLTNGHKDDDGDGGPSDEEQVLYGNYIGEIHLRPPDPGREYTGLQTNADTRDEGLSRQGQTIVIRGLAGFASVPDPIIATWTFERDSVITGGEAVTQTDRVGVPRRVSRHAAEAIDDYLQMLGLGLEMEQKDPQTKIDRDLLEEVDEWRSNNVDN